MKNYGHTQHFGHIDLLGNFIKNVTLDEVESYPPKPKVGSFIFLQKRVMVCLSIDSSPTWIPLTQEFNTYIHNQETASSSWTINHGMNNTGVIVQCFDDQNKVVIPDEIVSTDNNTVTVTFTQPILGKAIVLLGSFDGTPKPNTAYTSDFSNKTAVLVPHLLGYEPIIRVIVDGFEIQPKSIQHTDTNNAVVEFTSPTTGKVIAI